MKKLALIFLITFFTIITNAQITKGNWLVGGNAGFNYSKNESVNKNPSGTTTNYNLEGIYNISIEPNVGYFIFNNLAIGSKFFYGNAFYEGQKLSSENMRVGFGPFVRYYFMKSDKDYNVFLEPSFSRFIYNQQSNSNAYGLKSGFVFFLNNSVGVEATVNYSKATSLQYESTGILFGFGLQIHLKKE